MSYFSKMRLFQKAVVVIFSLFMGLMIFVTIVAYARRSGSTGMDMGKVQKMRYEESLKKEMFTPTQTP